MTSEKDATRFWSKVDRSAGPEGCWIWTASLHKAGYGQIRWRDSVVGAHRVAYELASGRMVPDGLFVCHSCDNPPCVNPAHLWLGDTSANSADMVAKGRGAMAARNGKAKLSDQDVQDMRDAYAAGGETYQSLATRYGVNKMTASRILKGDSYRRGAVASSHETDNRKRRKS